MDEKLEVKLEAYEGPLDLLLRLIQKNEIDIYDIPIATLTAQYLDAIANMPPNMEQMSEFLVMAATLLEIKSRMLLPRPKKEDAEDEGDPREALVQKLLAYQHAQALAQELRERTPAGERITSKGDKELLIQLQKDRSSPMDDIAGSVSLAHLTEIFMDVMNRRESRRDTVRADYGEMPRERFTVPEKVSHIRKLLQDLGHLSLKALFLDCQSKSEMVVTFLAVLEMARRGIIRTTQQKIFGDVEVLPCPA